MERFITGKPVSRSLRPCDLSTCTKDDIRAYFENTYDLDETLFTAIKDVRALYVCPDRLRLPLVFYLAHPASLYVNKFLLAGLITERVDVEFEALFETGVDEMSWDDTENYRMGGQFKWPAVEDVWEYRRKVRALVLDVIEKTPLTLPITKDSPWWAVFLGMEHERIHIETSSVLIRQLPVEMVEKPPAWSYAPRTAGSERPVNEFVSAEGGVVSLGKPSDFPSYGWDNEYGVTDVIVPPFEATKFVVTNAEFMEFVRDGGYSQRSLWTEEGWRWREYRQATHPTFWVCDKRCKSGCGSQLGDHSHCTLSASDERLPFAYRAPFDVIAMPLDWPCDVNYHEARAYCSWKGRKDGVTYRLPTEAEHRVMSGSARVRDAWAARAETPLSVPSEAPLLTPSDSEEDGDAPVTQKPRERKGAKADSTLGALDVAFREEPQANIAFAYCSATPVNMYPASTAGFHDVHGSVWEWCEDHFNGFGGFEPHFLYDDFSSPCFDGRHTMIMGGSWASTGDEASVFARYAFRRHFFQHLGFRLVRSKSHTPARLVGTQVFVMGAGITANPIVVEGISESVSVVKSANGQFEYERDIHVEAALVRHYGTPELYDAQLRPIIGDHLDYSQRLARSVLEAVARFVSPSEASLLQIGCECGGTALALSSHVQQVVAIDYVGRFVDTALRMRREGSVSFPLSLQSDQKTAVSFKPPRDAAPEKVVFKQLTWLPVEIGSHDIVLVTHFLTRAFNPKAWVLRVREVVRPGGVAVFVLDPWPRSDASNGRALDVFPPRSKWLSGTEGAPERTSDAIAALLGDGFTRVFSSFITHVGRESFRSASLSVSEVVAFRKASA